MAPPPPDDHSHAQEAREAEIKAHQDSVPPDELPLFMMGDTPLARSFARLGMLVKQRESAKRTESKARSSSKMEE
jgi:hypothetical protein